MNNKIYTKNKKLIIEIPLFKKRYNPYLAKYTGKMYNVIGIIRKQYDEEIKIWYPEEIGFAYNIDMSYKGKADQESRVFYNYTESEKDFKKLCKKLKIELREIWE